MERVRFVALMMAAGLMLAGCFNKSAGDDETSSGSNGDECGEPCEVTCEADEVVCDVTCEADEVVCEGSENTCRGGRAVLQIYAINDWEICDSMKDPSTCCPEGFSFVGWSLLAGAIVDRGHAICLED